MRQLKLASLMGIVLFLAGCQTNNVKQNDDGSVQIVHSIKQASLDDVTFIPNQIALNKYLAAVGIKYDIILKGVSSQQDLIAAELRKDTPPPEHQRKLVLEAAGESTLLNGMYSIDHGFNKSGKRQSDRFIQIGGWKPKLINPRESISISTYYNSGNSNSFTGKFLGLGATKNDYAQYINVTMQRDLGTQGTDTGKSIAKSYRIAIKRSCGGWGVNRLTETDAQLLPVGFATEGCSGDDVFNITRLINRAMLIDYQIQLVLTDPRVKLTPGQIETINGFNPFNS